MSGIITLATIWHFQFKSRIDFPISGSIVSPDQPTNQPTKQTSPHAHFIPLSIIDSGMSLSISVHTFHIDSHYKQGPLSTLQTNKQKKEVYVKLSIFT